MKFTGRLKYIFVIALAATLFSSFFAARAWAEVEPRQPAARVTVTAGAKTFEYVDEKIIPTDFTVAEQIELRKINAPLDR